MVGTMAGTHIRFEFNPSLTDDALNTLFGDSWPDHEPCEFTDVLRRSLVYVGAFDRDQLIGFVYLAWDGGVHAFLLDPTVHPKYRRQGIGLELVRHAIELARARGVEWIHVDFAAEIQPFYEKAGFRPTLAGLIHLRDRSL
jgi:GNAT superfamily N-acetyltransferase